MGLSYTFSLMAISLIRQILGTGILSLSNPFTNTELFALRLIPTGFEIPIFKSRTGAFLTFAVLAALVGAYKKSNDDKAAKAEKEAKAAKAAAAKAAAAKAKEANA